MENNEKVNIDNPRFKEEDCEDDDICLWASTFFDDKKNITYDDLELFLSWYSQQGYTNLTDEEIKKELVDACKTMLSKSEDKFYEFNVYNLQHPIRGVVQRIEDVIMFLEKLFDLNTIS